MQQLLPRARWLHSSTGETSRSLKSPGVVVCEICSMSLSVVRRVLD